MKTVIFRYILGFPALLHDFSVRLALLLRIIGGVTLYRLTLVSVLAIKWFVGYDFSKIALSLTY